MNQDETNESKQEWLDALDAVIAAPEHHKILFENERVRVLDTCIAPGTEHRFTLTPGLVFYTFLA